MNKVLIIHAHPEPRSFCASLAGIASEALVKEGCEVQVSDLYAMNFNPVGGEHDFSSRGNADYFKYQLEQVHAWENGLFTPEVQREMDKLEWCDTLIFNFPLWWFGLPAILKGWVDRVFAMGMVYGNGKGVYENGTYPHKTAWACLTTGGPEVAYNTGRNGDIMQILYPINHGMFYFAGMRVLQPFISYGPARKTDEEREAEIQRYIAYIAQRREAAPLYG
ncbi:MAG: NAD(P)H-dependent oxidoreductase [Flavobacteriales bacterium]|nr:NAD(P)H-dependent oxidoreductase [Flavobacteriales bacterium]